MESLFSGWIRVLDVFHKGHLGTDPTEEESKNSLPEARMLDENFGSLFVGIKVGYIPFSQRDIDSTVSFVEDIFISTLNQRVNYTDTTLVIRNPWTGMPQTRTFYVLWDDLSSCIVWSCLLGYFTDLDLGRSNNYVIVNYVF